LSEDNPSELSGMEAVAFVDCVPDLAADGGVCKYMYNYDYKRGRKI